MYQARLDWDPMIYIRKKTHPFAFKPKVPFVTFGTFKVIDKQTNKQKIDIISCLFVSLTENDDTCVSWGEKQGLGCLWFNNGTVFFYCNILVIIKACLVIEHQTLTCIVKALTTPVQTLCRHQITFCVIFITPFLPWKTSFINVPNNSSVQMLLAGRANKCKQYITLYLLNSISCPNNPFMLAC